MLNTCLPMLKDGHIVISEKADSDDSKDQDKAEK